MPQAEFDFGRVFSRAWQTMLKGGMPLGVIVVLGLLLNLVMNQSGLKQLAAGGNIYGQTTVFEPSMLLWVLVSIVISFVIQGLLMEMTAQLYSGYKADLGVALQWFLKHLVAYLWTGLLVGLGIVLGLVFLIIPGLVLAIWWSVSYYLVAKEKVSGTDALSRSKTLTGRAFGWTFLVFFVYVVIQYIAGIIPVVSVLLLAIVSVFSALLVGSLYEELRGLEVAATNAQPPKTDGATPAAPLPSDGAAVVDAPAPVN